MNKTNKFFKDATLYSGGNLFSNILNFITGIIIRRVLQPALMGVFNEIMLIFDYARRSHLGLIDSLDKELPYLYGKKDYQQAEQIRNIGFTLCLIVALSIVIGIIIVSFSGFTNDRLLINGLRIVSLIILFRLVASLYIVLNRSRHNFSAITKYTILVAVLDIGLKTVLVIKFGLYGLLWATALTAALGLIYFYKASSEKFKLVLNFPFKQVVHLLKIGFPIFIMGFVYMTLRNIDRIMIIRLLDRESLGLYTIALMVTVYIVQLPNLIYAVIFPRFYQAYGGSKDIFEIKELFIKPTLVFAYFFPILIGMVILGLPLLLKYALPAYMPGLLPAYLLLLGCSFISLVNMPGYLLIALNKQIYMVFIGGFAVLTAALLNYLLVVRFHFGLAGIAIGTSIGYFLYTTILMAYSFSNYTKRFLAHLKFFIELYLPFVWIVLLLLILQGFTFKSTENFFKDFSIVFYKAVFFLLGCLPLALYANKKTAILTLLSRNTFFNKA